MKDQALFNLRDGLSQTERIPVYLNPDYFKIDERNKGDFLSFAIQLAPLFKYYNFNNQPDGTWEDFFDSDIDVLTELIIRIDLKKYIKEYELLSNALISAEEDDTIIQSLNELFSFLYYSTLPLLIFKEKLNLAGNRNASTVRIAGVVADSDTELSKFLTLYTQAVHSIPGLTKLDLSDLPMSIAVDYTAANIWDKSPDNRSRVSAALPYINDLFSRIRLKYSRLTLAAENYIKGISEQEGNVYKAHLGLFVTFLDLYTNLQHEINKLTGKHLDYYYNDILNIKPKPVVPDKLHVVFEAAPRISHFVLHAGEEIVGEIPETNQKPVYKLEHHTVISNAKIQEHKTIFISKQIQIPASRYGLHHLEEIKVYKGEYTVAHPGSYLKQKDNYKPWPVLGEEQSELPLLQRTMSNAAIGLLLSSPALFVQDGERHIRIRLYIAPRSAQWFNDYVGNFAALRNADTTVVVHEILNNAFNLAFTGRDGWIRISRHNVLFITGNGSEPFLELNFILSANDPAIEVYSKTVHGDCDISSPAIKLEVNNASFHNAYTFLKFLMIERVSIKADVKGSRIVKLQNSIGPLSPLTPFQPFGPIPTIGSYLEVKNTNIFNRYTKNFCINILWFDLPKEPGGFETYFKGYDNGIGNDSFKVSLSTVRNGRTLPEQRLQQSFRLFETTRDPYRRIILKDITAIDDIDWSRIDFTNNMALDKENMDATAIVQDGGMVRIELTAPSDAFGHKLYPQIFPGIITNNARRFSKKHDVPNPPYIPVIKSLHLDYTLEHTEVLQKKGASDHAAKMSLVHLHPFGYKQAYPARNPSDIFMVPDLQSGSCLLIGLSDLVPGQHVSILFQLDEMNFHHATHKVEDVTWSYLNNNKWINFRPADILSDSTNNFINSGIVRLQIPDDIRTGNTILNPALFWIKAAVHSSQTAAARVIALFTQASSAIRVSPDAPGTSEFLPPNTVKGFTRKIPQVTKLWQFFPSTEGKLGETRDQYRIRVSERLRHKQRPLTALDISQIILEQFPEILLVKCFGPGVSDDFVLPDVNVQIIVIPKEREDGKFISQEPKVSLAGLYRIKRYINKITSEFASVEVGNPLYEKIKVKCSISIVKDKVNTNNGYYTKLLNDDLRSFLSPWLFGDSSDFKIGGKVYVLDLLNFIRERPYINFVTGFSVLHFYERYNMLSNIQEALVTDSGVSEISYLEASRPDAILIAADSHDITVLGDVVYEESRQSGIGDLTIGNELRLHVPGTTTLATEGDNDTGEPDEYFDFGINN